MNPRRLLLYKGMQHRLAAGMLRSLSFPRDADREDPSSISPRYSNPITRYYPPEIFVLSVPDISTIETPRDRNYSTYYTPLFLHSQLTELRLETWSEKVATLSSLELSSHSQPRNPPRRSSNLVNTEFTSLTIARNERAPFSISRRNYSPSSWSSSSVSSREYFVALGFDHDAYTYTYIYTHTYMLGEARKRVKKEKKKKNRGIVERSFEDVLRVCSHREVEGV